MGRLVAFERLQRTTWGRIQNTIERLAERYTPNTVAVDATRDNKIVQDLEDSIGRVDPVDFTASKKRTLIDNLITRLEAGDLTLSSDAPVLINELEVYEYDITESGRVRYSAPSGFKDDCVEALALAAEQREIGTGGGLSRADHTLSEVFDGPKEGSNPMGLSRGDR